MITDATFAWAFFSTQTNARVAAIQSISTGLAARRTITWLMAKLAASLVRALPGAGLSAWSTGLPAWLQTLTVVAAIFTSPLTGGAVTKARLTAHVRANQETLTPEKT